MSGIARSAAAVVVAAEVDAGRGPPRAPQRRRAIARLRREVERLEPRRRLAGDAPRASARRASRCPGSGSRTRAISRRWIAIARSSSISCSVIAPSERLPRVGLPARRAAAVASAPSDRSPGRRGSGRGTPRRSSSTPVAKRIRSMPARAAASACAAGGEQDAVARRLDDADEHGLAVDPQQALQRGAAPARPARPCEPPPRRNGHGGRTSTRTSVGSAEQIAGQGSAGPSPGGSGGRRPGTSSTTRSRRGPPSCAACAGAAGAAAVHDRHGGGAGHEPGRRQGGRLTGGHEGPRGLDRPRLGHDGQAVDDLAVVFLEVTHGFDSMKAIPDGCLVTPFRPVFPNRSGRRRPSTER